ncbi:MAG: tetratricopeptide repeat protein [Chlorobi bacterium]|nr:tetratricopeptide repeat protein [Chlorobiota bacterium]
MNFNGLSKLVLFLTLLIFSASLISSCGDDKEALKEKKAEKYFKKAMQLTEESDYLEALKFFDSALKLKPDDELAYFNRAVIKHNLGKYKEAIKDYTKAISLMHEGGGEGEGGGGGNEEPNPKAEAYNYRALAKMKLEDYRGAIADYGEAIKLDANVAEYYVNRAEALKILDYMDAACLDWSKAGELGDEEVYDLIKKYCN